MAAACVAVATGVTGISLHGIRPATHEAVQDSTPRPEIPVIDVRPAAQPATRPVYRYSIIPGGAYDSAELIRALETDPVAAHHYGDFRLSEVHTVAAGDQPVYVSYRMGKNIYWTSHPIRLLRGETLLTDGSNVARARCGNRISTKPMAPIATKPVPAETLDVLEAPVTIPAAPAAPALIAEVFPPAIPSTPGQVAAQAAKALPADSGYQGAPFALMGYYGGGLAAPVSNSGTPVPIQPSPFQPIETGITPLPLPGPIYIPAAPPSPVLASAPTTGGGISPGTFEGPVPTLPGIAPSSIPSWPVPVVWAIPTVPVPAVPESTPQGWPPAPPETPSTPESPGTPETPETPNTPQTPGTPQTPDTPQTPPVPEPSTMLLTLGALAGLCAWRERRA